VTAQLEELRVPAKMSGVGIGDQRPCVIDQHFLRRSAKMVKAGFDGLEDRRLGFVQADGVVLASAVAEGHAEDNDLGELATQGQRVRRPIELALPTRRRLEADGGFARRCGRPELLQVRVERRRAAAIAKLAELAQDARADQVLTVVPRVNLRRVRL
jgi:hypothetical protein